MKPQTIFIPVANTEEYGEVLILRYTSPSLRDCHWQIMQVASSFGFTGSIEGRLAELGWTIKEFTLTEVNHDLES